MTDSESALSLRADLVQRRISMGRQSMWVVKDPLSRAYFYFTDEEHAILNLADGRHSLTEIATEYATEFAPRFVSVEALVRFFNDARKRGLVVLSGADVPLADAPQIRRRRWWHNPLAVRVPGVNPDRFLDAGLPWVGWLFTPLSLALTVLSLVAAVLIVMTHFDAFAAHVATSSARLATGDGLLMMLVVISVTKIIHELAHGFACKFFGGECREMGIMFLVGVPCLYCDVSDAWLMQKRWQRIFVSAAGIWFELALASAATIVWILSSDGTVRDLCVTVMVVCSITTIIFNGNPLLRYDGYFILADQLGMPNLAQKSTATIRAWIRHFVWGTAAPTLQCSRRMQVVTVVYGIASGIYRTAIFLFIIHALYRFADNTGLGDIAGVLGLSAVGLLVYRFVKPVMQRPTESETQTLVAQRRPLLIQTTVLAVILLLCLVPLPRRVIGTMLIQPAGAQMIFVKSEGTIKQSVAYGSEVKVGDAIASLDNGELKRELLAIRSHADRLASELESLQKRRSTNRDVADRIPVVQQLHDQAVKQWRLRERMAEHLTLRSPSSGRVFAPPSLPPQRDSDDQPLFWHGHPLDRINRGGWFEQGTVLCVVGNGTEREAIVSLRQQDVELIRVDQRVKLILADRKRGAVRGRVVEIAATPQQRTSDSITVESGPVYQVRVMLDSNVTALPVRLSGHASISVDDASILSRVGRFLSDTFG